MLSILFEDDHVLVVNKPAGLVCHPSKNGPESSLIGRVRLYLGWAGGHLVNRLDRETSGVVVVAKREDAARELGALLAHKAVTKRYVAVVHGDPGDERYIDAPLGKDESSAVAIKDCVRSDGAAATTRVRRMRRVPGEDGPFSLVDVEPCSGRKHQIRIHLAHVGCPIVGDKIYGGDEGRYLRFVTRTLTDRDRQDLIVSCHALHAAELSVTWRGDAFTWNADVPDRIVDLCHGRAVFEASEAY